jgi:hypothetical protein
MIRSVFALVELDVSNDEARMPGDEGITGAELILVPIRAIRVIRGFLNL